MTALGSIKERLRATLNERARGVGGAVVGVAVGGEEIVLAHGIANLNTGQLFTEDTGFLLGSVTKVLVTVVLLRLVERGLVDLESPVQRYVPDFALHDADAAAKITVRMLVNHTNGIDADALCPAEVRGRDASRHYTAYLSKLGVLFEPGAGLHYSNPGFVLAARVIEEVTGLTFERAMQVELFDPAGMRDATALQTQAFLRRTAIGAFADPQTNELNATPVFTLGEGLAGGGTTLIVTPRDMLAFGRMHLSAGIAHDGAHLLAGELVSAMQTVEFDIGVPGTPTVGLGWWIFDMAGTPAFHHAGGSPGGTSSFCILPEHDAVIVSFATGPGARALNDALHNDVIGALTGKSPTLEIDPEPHPIPPSVAGDYEAFQLRRHVEVVGGDKLVLADAYEPYDDEHRAFFKDMFSAARYPAITYRTIAPSQYAPVSVEARDLSGFHGRCFSLLATLPPTAHRRAGLYTGLRFTPKVG